MSQPVRPKTLLRAVNDTLRVHAASAILAFLFILFLPSWIRWFWFTACGLLLMVSILANFVEDWRPKSRVPVSGKAVVISVAFLRTVLSRWPSVHGSELTALFQSGRA
ncbi:hypothetical protein NPIL_96801 [Nephila pilipes]|uniref:Uncharacterized protein n=1 Tax=Nephila pilipes TaxID=299642 RepID=A0A8X6MIB1_NEPPI|nr:hypothetical protein NPIL_96801 [Nephila pilipes]